MSTWVAFLRGVNLGKRQMKMAELREACEDLGFAGVKTIVASGNVRFETDNDSGLKQRLEAGLADRFGFAVKVILRTAEGIETMIAAAPFAKLDPGLDAACHVLLFAEPMKSRPKITPVEGDYEAVRIDEDAIFFAVYKKSDGTYLARSTLGDVLKPIEKAHVVTMRNWNTMLKLLR